MSEFHIEVVRLGPISKHPDADSLSITSVYGDPITGEGGYPCIMKTGTFNEGDLVTYVPVDSMAPLDNPHFEFLAKSQSPRTLD